MNELCKIIKEMVKPNFLNIRTSIRTYDRDALCCGSSGIFRSTRVCSTDRLPLQPASSRCGYRRRTNMWTTAFSSADRKGQVTK